MWFLGVDWAETHHDVCLMDEAGGVLARQRITDSLPGASQLQALVAQHAPSPDQVMVGIETDRGLLVHLLVSTGYQVYAVNPLSVSRYRQRHTLSGAKSDPADAKLLADLVRTDRQNHRTVAGDSPQGQAVTVLARHHQRLIWARQRHVNQLRSLLREFYPSALLAFGSDLATPDALAVLAKAPSPSQARRLPSKALLAALRRGGRQRNLQHRADEIRAALLTPQLELPPVLVNAYSASVKSLVTIIASFTQQIAALEVELVAAFKAHPDAEIVLSLPGLGEVLGARVTAGFGDDPNRYVDSRARKNYASSSPVTIASGHSRRVQARFPRHTWLADAGFLWAFCSLTQSSAAKAYYDAHRARGHTHAGALRALANRWFGILHGCLRYRTLYSEDLAWPALAPSLSGVAS